MPAAIINHLFNLPAISPKCFEDLQRSRTISCPYCKKGKQREIEIMERRMSGTELPRQYAAADLHHWGNPKHESRIGKVKAYLACRAMLDDPKHQISSHRLAAYHLKLFGKSSPD